MHKNRSVLEVFKKIIVVLGAVTTVFVVINATPLVAQSYFSAPTALCKSGAFATCPEGQTATEAIQYVAGGLAKNVRVIIGAVAIAIIIVAGFQLVLNDGSDEAFDKTTQTIVYAIIGLFMIGLAGEISQIFRIDSGGFLKDPNSALQTSRFFTRTVQIIITFIKYIIGSFAVYMMVSSGLRMILVGSKDEELATDKKKIAWGLAGLVIILMANPIITKVFYKIDTDKFPGVETVRPTLDRIALLKEIAGATNIMASFAGPFALLALVAGGVMYTFAAGNDDQIAKAKKIITWALIGIVIIYGAFAIVSLFVTREFAGI